MLYMKTIKLLLLGLMMILFTGMQAQSLQPLVCEDQFGEQRELNEQTQWLIFSYSMDGGNWVRDAFNELQINTSKMDEKNILYIADIHEMPRVISKMIALPRMRDYAFSIGLDTEGALTESWQRKEKMLTVYELKNLEVVQVTFYSDFDSVLKRIKSM